MQIIQPVSLTPDHYFKANYHTQMRSPENCPNCRHPNCLSALGYYERYITCLLEVLRIWIRRFRCKECRISVSCLPDFAQPYRAVNTATVEAGFNGDPSSRSVQHWGSLIEVYWKSFTRHLGLLLRTVGSAYGRCPPHPNAEDFWQKLKGACDGLPTVTRELVDKFRTCLFGTYQCHQRRILSS